MKELKIPTVFRFSALVLLLCSNVLSALELFFFVKEESSVIVNSLLSGTLVLNSVLKGMLKLSID